MSGQGDRGGLPHLVLPERLSRLETANSYRRRNGYSLFGEHVTWTMLFRINVFLNVLCIPR